MAVQSPRMKRFLKDGGRKRVGFAIRRKTANMGSVNTKERER